MRMPVQKRSSMQNGSLIKSNRRNGQEVWENSRSFRLCLLQHEVAQESRRVQGRSGFGTQGGVHVASGCWPSQLALFRLLQRSRVFVIGSRNAQKFVRCGRLN